MLRKILVEFNGADLMSGMALDFLYQPVRISVRFTQNYVENRVLTHCG